MEIFLMKQLNLQVHLKSFLLRGKELIKCAISLTEKASEKLDGVIELLGDIV